MWRNQSLFCSDLAPTWDPARPLKNWVNRKFTCIVSSLICEVWPIFTLWVMTYNALQITVRVSIKRTARFKSVCFCVSSLGGCHQNGAGRKQGVLTVEGPGNHRSQHRGPSQFSGEVLHCRLRPRFERVTIRIPGGGGREFLGNKLFVRKMGGIYQ